MKSDDIDELFREAAEKYHIDTEKASAWDEVFDAVHGTGKPGPPTPPRKDDKKRWLNLLWLLLIPLGWFAHNAWNNIQDNKLTKKQQTQQQQVAAATPDKTTEQNGNTKQPGSDNSSNNQGNQQADNTIPTTGTNADKAPAGTIVKDDNKNATGNGTGIMANKQAIGSMRVRMQLNKTLPGNNLNQQGVVAGNANKRGDINVTKDNNNATQPLALNPGSTPPATTKPAGSNNNAVAQTPVTIPNGAAENVTGKNNQQQTGLVTVDGSDAKKADTTGKGAARMAQPTYKKVREHYFYVGMLGSPDISLIHMQKASRVGVSAGIVVGYQLNKHWGIEAGALFDKKNYYTTGEYFDKNKITWFNQRPDVVVHSLTGSCRMIEIPVNVRYTFNPGSKNRWYASAGISSYLMGRESYTYDISHGTGPTYPTSIEYNNNPKNWFSILNLGAGYERSLGTKTNLRIEPFVKLPVSGVGSGNISLTSTGVFIGVTRRIP